MSRLKRRYWAMHDMGLENGSFVRTRLDGETMAQWMNGDLMGLIKKVPKNFKEVPQEHAEKLIPQCCL